MIARTWRGWTSRADADAYVAYLLDTGLAAYHQAFVAAGSRLARSACVIHPNRPRVNSCLRGGDEDGDVASDGVSGGGCFGMGTLGSCG